VCQQHRTDPRSPDFMNFNRGGQILDPKLYPLEELAALYARRWRLATC
jgi:hypothetical protein